MHERIFRDLILVCLIVNAIFVTGSSRIYSNDQQERNRRHASCPSCNRDCPEALVSWDIPPSKREYNVFEPEITRRSINQPYQLRSPFSSSPYDPYDRASRSRGTTVVNRSRNTSKRENPFALQREFDFNVAPSSSVPVHGVEGPVIPYRPRVPLAKSQGRTFYRKPNFYDVVRPESYQTMNNEYSDYDSFDEEPFEVTDRFLNTYRDFKKKVPMVYGSDKFVDDFIEEDIPNVRSEQYSRTQVPNRRIPAGVKKGGFDRFFQPRRDQPRESIEEAMSNVRPEQYSRIQGSDRRNLVVSRMEGLDRFSQSRKDKFRDFGANHTPEVKYHPYDMDPNIFRTMRNLGRMGIVVGNGSPWQDLKELESERPFRPVENNHRWDGAVKETNDDDQGNDGSNPREDQDQEFKWDAMGGSNHAENWNESKMSRDVTQPESLSEDDSLESSPLITDFESVEGQSVSTEEVEPKMLS
ncbi:uncharacterized protein LOC143153540 [Ptiloglossa arizonensis]|uniref:uncharacterized protein LOC143153540 n=1 Tax=Ptiloglossa arizonensis TaxID=3350558 RepID=UPI003F9F2EF9